MNNNSQVDYETNKYGVKGIQRYKVFIPECCLCCEHYDWEPTQDGWGETFYYCKIGIKFPEKKGTCKRQNKNVFA